MREDNYRDISAFGGLPIYLAVILVFFAIKNYTVVFQLALGLVLAYGLTTFFRLAYFKQRPEKQKYKNWWQKIDASSFPSLHSIRAALLAVVFSVFFLNFLLYVMFAVAALGVAVTRILLKRHDKIDAAAGLIIGLVIGCVVVSFNYSYFLAMA